MIPFGLIWSPARGFTIILGAIVALATVYAFGRVIRSLLDPDVRARNQLDLLRVRVRSMLSESVRERIGNIILHEKLGDGKEIDTFHTALSRSWIETDAQEYLFVDAHEDGWLSDVHLGELEKLGKRLDRLAREQNFTLSKASTRRAPDVSQGTAYTQQEGQEETLPVRKVYLLKRYREEVPSDSFFYAKQRSILAVPKSLARSAEFRMEIEVAIPQIFRFTKDAPVSVAIRREVQGIKDQLAQAIRDISLGTIDELREVYLQVAEEFLRELVRLGGGYNAEQARQERSNFFTSWAEIRWLESDLRELITLTRSVGNTDVFNTVGFVPFAISMRAIQVKDHYLFQRFFQFALLIYAQSRMLEGNANLRNRMMDLSWRWPKELSEHYIASELRFKSLSMLELNNLQDFALHSIRVFQDLLKSMADARDVQTFSKALTQLYEVYEEVSSDENDWELAVLGDQLSRSIEATTRDTLAAELERREKRKEIARALRFARDETRLALAGRILDQHLSAPDDEDLRTLFTLIKSKLPSSLKSLTETFAEASNSQNTDFWGWDLWDMIPDGEAHWLDTHTKLNRIFVVHALDILAGLPEEQRQSIELPVSRALADMASHDNAQGLGVIISQIDENRDRWRGILSEGALECIPVLQRKLDIARRQDENDFARYVRESPLDEGRLNDFRNAVVESFKESVRLRPIFEHSGLIETVSREESDRALPSLGYNQIDDKGAFVHQERTSYVGWGRAYGQGLARAEDEAVFEKMVESATERKFVAPGTLAQSIAATIDSTQMTQPAIIQSLRFTSEYKELYENPSFTQRHNRELRSEWKRFEALVGVLHLGSLDVPVFTAFARRPSSQNKALLFDMADYLRWHQHDPADTEDEGDIFDVLLIKVTDLNVDTQKRRSILESNPPWLNDHDEPDPYLRGHALVNIYERFKVDIREPNSAVCFHILKDGDEGLEDD